jgi:hypothetical protein
MPKKCFSAINYEYSIEQSKSDISMQNLGLFLLVLLLNDLVHGAPSF